MTTNTIKLIDEYLTQGGYSPGIDPETLEREAALVAAAPDLLAALEAVTRDLVCTIREVMDNGGSEAWICEAQARLTSAQHAITKAKGE